MRAFWIAGVLVLGLTGPAFAQTPLAAANATPAAVAATPDATTPTVATLAASAETPLDVLVQEATAPEDRARLMLRCSGPPPRLVADKAADARKAAPPLPPAKDPLG